MNIQKQYNEYPITSLPLTSNYLIKLMHVPSQTRRDGRHRTVPRSQYVLCSLSLRRSLPSEDNCVQCTGVYSTNLPIKVTSLR